MDINSQDATRPYIKTKKQGTAAHQAPQERSSNRMEEKRGTREGIRGASLANLLSTLDRLADQVVERAGKILSVAYGGEAYSGDLDHKGDPIDSISHGIFCSIIGMSENATPYHELKEVIAELSYLAKATPALTAVPAAIHPQPNQVDILQSAKDAVWVAEVGMSCFKDSVAPIMSAIEALSHVEDMDGGNLSKRVEVIQRLAHVGVIATDDMMNTLDCEREAMQGKLDALRGGQA